ncbi:hypothetical protein RCH06_000307 [Polaromonas sp. CG_9.5]|nr:hypothetical protein [Polaromonas sp. CG_9.5]
MIKTSPCVAPLQATLDHLVVLASSLDEGTQWCEAVLGVTPGPGGEHALMGTHNRLLSMASALYPQAYLEIIAINPGAVSVRPPSARRWFDMDCAKMQRRLATDGPRLGHIVARTAQAQAGVAALAGLGLDRGQVLQASRPTPHGLLQWRITVRQDGQRLFYGMLPTLIEWSEIHPSASMPPSGLTLHSLQAHHPRHEALQAAYNAIGLAG